jgi:two-component system chemotaxis response regulator CheY
MADAQFRFLIVDNYPTMRRIMRNLLMQIGYPNVKEAEHGLAALIKLRTEQFDFLITDHQMPVMDGLTLLHEMRADKALASIPALMVLTGANKENIIASLQAGASGYIIKPFTAEVLNEKITKILDEVEKLK